MSSARKRSTAPSAPPQPPGEGADSGGAATATSDTGSAPDGTILTSGFDDWSRHTARQTAVGLDAWSESGTAALMGTEAIARSWLGLTQMTLDGGVRTMRSVMTASSISEVIDLQAAFTKNTFDMIVAESVRTSELCLKTANDAVEPLNTCVNSVMTELGRS